MGCARCCGIIRRYRGLEGAEEGERKEGRRTWRDGVTTRGRWFGVGVEADIPEIHMRDDEIASLSICKTRR